MTGPLVSSRKVQRHGYPTEMRDMGLAYVIAPKADRVAEFVRLAALEDSSVQG